MSFPNTKTIKAGIYYSIAVTTDRMGRMSAVVFDHVNRKNIIDIELPQRSKKAEYRDAFKPTVTVSSDINIEVLGDTK